MQILPALCILGFLAPSIDSLCSHQSAHASLPGEIEDLEERFEAERDFFDSSLTAARKMRVPWAELGASISSEECRRIQKHIRANYILSPWSVYWEDGSSRFLLCEPSSSSKIHYRPEAFYYQQTLGVNSFGVEYSQVLQVEARLSKNSVQISLFLDDGGMIVSLSTQMLQKNSVQISEIDSDESLYSHEYRMDDDFIRPEYRVTFSSYGGRIPQAIRVGRPSKHKGRFIQVTRITRANVHDWDGYYLVPTHALWGGFYRYRDRKQLVREPRSLERLDTYQIAGKVVCKEGWVRYNQVWERFPPLPSSAPSGKCHDHW